MLSAMEKEYLLEQNSKLKDEVVNLQRQLKKYKYDNLTGLHLRADFNEMLDTMWYEFQEFSHDFVMVMIDLNGLHAINRDIGFDAGDSYIIDMARDLKETFPEMFIYRIGGDEFMLLKKGTMRKECENFLKELKTAEFGATSTEFGYDAVSEMFNFVDNEIIRKKLDKSDSR
jgi:diguanylate cyclase (GGDEF)-like protein